MIYRNIFVNWKSNIKEKYFFDTSNEVIGIFQFYFGILETAIKNKDGNNFPPRP